MRSWVQILHFYQPPTQNLVITREILEQCYLPLLDTLLNHPKARVTLNISGSLVEQIKTINSNDFINKIKQLLDKDQIELLNSPSFHPLIPITPVKTVKRQLDKNKQLLNEMFRVSPIGVYPPELALNQESLEILGGYEFAIADEGSILGYDHLGEKIITDCVYQHGQLKLLVSSRLITEIIRSYPTELRGNSLVTYLLKNTKENDTFVSVNDAELFGHHYKERLQFLKEVYESKEIEFLKASEILSKIESKTIAEIAPATWETYEENAQQKNFYPLWLSKDNSLQEKYHELVLMVKKIVEEAPVVKDSYLEEIALRHYDHGVSSCHFYWLSNWPWWHPDLVQNGLTELIRAVRTLPIDYSVKVEAEKLYHELSHQMWQYHWSGKVEVKYNSYNQYRREFLKDLPEL